MGVLKRLLTYLDEQWERLTRYLDDGRLAIDNNLTENAIRPFVVGRKNWLCVTRRRTYETDVKLAA